MLQNILDFKVEKHKHKKYVIQYNNNIVEIKSSNDVIVCSSFSEG